MGKVKNRSITQIKRRTIRQRNERNPPFAPPWAFLTHGVVSALELGPGQPPINVNKRLMSLHQTLNKYFPFLLFIITRLSNGASEEDSSTQFKPDERFYIFLTTSRNSLVLCIWIRAVNVSTRNLFQLPGKGKEFRNIKEEDRQGFSPTPPTTSSSELPNFS